MGAIVMSTSNNFSKSRSFQVITWIVLLCLGIYGFFIEPAWVEVTYHRRPFNYHKITHWERVSEPSFETLKPGNRIVQISDLHISRIGRTENAVIEKINNLKPRILLLTGDIIDRPENLSVLESFLQKLEVTDKFAVLGNWEYWGEVNIRDLREAYARNGVTLLINECVEREYSGRIYRIAGLDDFTAGKPDEVSVHEQYKKMYERYSKAIHNAYQWLPKDMILMQHSPGYFATSNRPKESKFTMLSLSGHTHAGQVTFFGVSLWTPTGSSPFVSGWYATNHGDLYVSRGIGTSVLPARFGARPEIAVFDMD